MGALLIVIVRGTREIDLLQIFFANPHSGETHTLRVCCRLLFEKETRRPRYVESFYVPKFRFRNTFSGFAARDEQVTQVAYSSSIARNLPFLFLSASSLSFSRSLALRWFFFSIFDFWVPDATVLVFVLSFFTFFWKRVADSVQSSKLRLVPSFVFFPFLFSLSLSLSLSFLFSFFWKGRSAKISSIGWGSGTVKQTQRAIVR